MSIVRAFLNDLCNCASLRLAIVGDGDGNVEVPARPNFVYARLEDANGAVIEARATLLRNDGSALQEGDVVYVGLENPAAPNAWRAVFWVREE